MKINIATLFPEMCEAVINTSIIGRAKAAGKMELEVFNIRDYSENKHHNVDDTPYGGGPGMVMQVQPIYDCCKAIEKQSEGKPFVIFTTAAGRVFDQKLAIELSKKPNLTIVCGHYEGIDERVIEELADMEISIGDFVLTGGELPALVITDAVCRMLDGVLKSEEGFTDESHYNGLLEYAQYTRPYEWHGKEVPAVLASGHDKNIKDFRKNSSLERTRIKRPDMYEKYIKENPIIDKPVKKRKTRQN
ncbi:MAG: tRNA (guanosine(37)-N1)-methyltransferase TrmD [Oscillospiraceae bacterium]